MIGAAKSSHALSPTRLRTSTAILDALGGHQTIGRANSYLAELAVDAFLKPTKAEGETRLELFVDAVKGGAKRGAGMGAALGFGTMCSGMIDLLLGTGGTERHAHDFRAEGLFGLTAHGAIDVCSYVGAGVGAGLGGAAGLLGGYCVYGDDARGGLSVVAECADDGARVAGTFVAGAISIPVGMALGLARLPSLIVKGSLALVCGVVGAVLGLFGGAYRACKGVAPSTHPPQSLWAS